MGLATLLQEMRELPEHYRYGRVTGVLGMLLELGGVPQSLAAGGRCEALTRETRRIACEVVGFRNHRALAMPFGPLEGVGLGSKAEVLPAVPAIHPWVAWLGRVVNVLRSISRTMPGCNDPQENAPVLRARRLIAAYEDMAEPIRLGAYRRGSDAKVDEAIEYHPALETFLSQPREERAGLADGYARLATLLEGAKA